MAEDLKIVPSLLICSLSLRGAVGLCRQGFRHGIGENLLSFRRRVGLGCHTNNMDLHARGYD